METLTKQDIIQTLRFKHYQMGLKEMALRNVIGVQATLSIQSEILNIANEIEVLRGKLLALESAE